MAGSRKWTLTRLINGYVVRKYGFDAMARVSRGELSLTNPGFLEAADVVRRMALQGYFGEHVNTADLDEAIATFLQGRAAINCSYRARTKRRTVHGGSAGGAGQAITEREISGKAAGYRSPFVMKLVQLVIFTSY
ncbi:hypothetical protein [Cohnella hashimotonis]|uniref:Uncharacterized protein n=1 Tax=Cohnella hashimotonis TaxID=2826895 RepID=A0ABT6TB52_9BACL|nr:hypothetical protein [Cohnella hashimotonis]MDI4643801.1 hypothetical protein [Cohnella hashimotonis]